MNEITKAINEGIITDTPREYDAIVRVTKVIDSHNFQVSFPLLCKKWWEFWK
jgi:hypothetical protein